MILENIKGDEFEIEKEEEKNRANLTVSQIKSTLNSKEEKTKII